MARIPPFLWMALAIVSSAMAPLCAVERGDVAIIGLRTDGDDAFAWVALRELSAGERVVFSDAGWHFDGFTGNATVSDGAVEYVVPAGGLAAGSVQEVPLDGSGLPAGYAPLAGTELGPAMLAGSFGDQLVALTFTAGRPSFLFAIHTNSSRWVLSAPAPNRAAESLLYPSLSAGRTAVALGVGPEPGDEVDNCVYRGPKLGTSEDLLRAIATRSNWDCTDGDITDITDGTLVSGFDVASGALFRRGNVNGDDETDVTDAIFILDALFLGERELTCRDAADVNDDGENDITDPISLLGFLFLGLRPPPPPLDTCGPDPTQDALDCTAFPPCR